MKDKATKKTQTQQSIFDIPDSIIPEDKRLFLPTWDNKPPHQQTIITTQGKRVLTTGNMLAIVSKPGAGKSSICEAIVSSILNSKCDSLGFDVKLQAPRDKVLYIDTERTPQDTWNSWERTYRRAGLKKPEIDKRVIFANFKAISLKDKKMYVETFLKNNKDIGLIIFDGAGDFVQDTNSVPDSCAFIDWINTFNFSISIVVSIHTNPDAANKPRGHMGSELCRRAESVFLVQKLDDGIREITTTFTHGKVRNDGDNISYHYKYSDENNMFISTEYVPKKAATVEKNEKNKEIIEAIFNGKTELSFGYIVNKLMDATAKGNGACEQMFNRSFKNEFIIRSENGWKLKI